MNSEKLEKNLKLLKSLQNRDGSFNAELPNDKQINTFSSVFYTALISRALSPIHPLSIEIISGCSRHLLKESRSGNWNYFPRNSKTIPIPDDTDDGANACIALLKANMLDASNLRDFLKTLKRMEIQPGGPYLTWVTKKQPSRPDPIVNANIYALLGQFGIQSKQMDKYFYELVQNRQYHSPFYCHPGYFFYSLSHSKTSTELKNLLLNAVDQEILKAKPESEYLLLLLISKRKLSPQSTQTKSPRSLKPTWHPLVQEGGNNLGKISGSIALNLALSIEILTLTSEKNPFATLNKCFEQLSKDSSEIESRNMSRLFSQTYSKLWTDWAKYDKHLDAASNSQHAVEKQIKQHHKACKFLDTSLMNDALSNSLRYLPLRNTETIKLILLRSDHLIKFAVTWYDQAFPSNAMTHVINSAFENLIICYQLLDDLQDQAADLLTGRRTLLTKGKDPTFVEQLARKHLLKAKKSLLFLPANHCQILSNHFIYAAENSLNNVFYFRKLKEDLESLNH